MRRHWIPALVALFVVAVVALAVMLAGRPVRQAGALASFGSDAELRSFLRRAIAINIRERGLSEMTASDSAAEPMPAPPATKVSAPAGPDAPSITNNQIADVD